MLTTFNINTDTVSARVDITKQIIFIVMQSSKSLSLDDVQKHVDTIKAALIDSDKYTVHIESVYPKCPQEPIVPPMYPNPTYPDPMYPNPTYRPGTPDDPLWPHDCLG